MTRQLATVALLLAALCLFTACGESYSEVSARHQEGLDVLRVDLAKLGELIPSAVVNKKLAAPLDPVPKFIDEDPSSNTSIMIWERLADPTAEFGDKELMELYLSNGLANFFVWESWDKSVSDTFEQELKAALAIRYLVGYRMLRYVPPVVTSETQYTMGSAVLGVHVFDREKQEIVCAFPVLAGSSPTVNYKFREGEDKIPAIRKWARSDLWTNLRVEILKKLAENTAGTFRK